MDFTVLASQLSAEADNRLGDLILYAVNGAGGGDFVPMKARVLAKDPVIGFAANEETKGGWHLRIAKEKVPSPSRNDRVMCAEIFGEDAVYRPIPKLPVDAGRYWLIDLQRV